MELKCSCTSSKITGLTTRVFLGRIKSGRWTDHRQTGSNTGPLSIEARGALSLFESQQCYLGDLLPKDIDRAFYSCFAILGCSPSNMEKQSCLCGDADTSIRAGLRNRWQNRVVF